MSTELWHHQTKLTVLFFASDWDDAQQMTGPLTGWLGNQEIVDDLWIASLETYGPTYNQPWSDDDPDGEPPWGSDTRRFRAELYLVLGVTGFEEVWEFTERIEDEIVDWKRMNDEEYIDNAYFGFVQNLGKVDGDDTEQ